MILINADENGLGKPKWAKHINLKNAIKMAVAPQLLIPKKNLNFKNAVKLAVAPHTLFLKNHSKPNRQPRSQPRIQSYVEPSYNNTDSFEEEGDLGLGKSKKPKKGFKKLIRKVSLKNTLKVVKFAGPLVAGIIPGGGTAMKVLDSKVGKTIMKVAKSKIVKKGVKLAQSKVGRAVVNQVKAKIEGVSEIEPRGFSQTTAMESTTSGASESEKEPVGELTPVKQVESSTEKFATPVTQKKDNTMLYAIGAVVVVGGIYMATKK
jgi:hypothetical protein